MVKIREITLRIDSETDDELTELARQSGRDKVSLARDALVEWLENQEDIRDAEAVIAQSNPTIPLEEVKRTFGLAR
jgi:predicted transcriptional regulator